MTRLRIAAALAAAALLLAGCSNAERDYQRAVHQVIPDNTAALLVGEGVCDLYEDDVPETDVDAALGRLGFDTAEATIIGAAAWNHLCDQD